jgi:hypothetical protein
VANPGAFQKDLGYLMPFLDKVAAAAEELPDAAARDELLRLITEEKARWTRIRDLLGGAPGRSGAQAGAPLVSQARAPTRLPEGAPKLARESADTINRVAPGMAGFTVGSLKGVR